MGSACIEGIEERTYMDHDSFDSRQGGIEMAW